MLKKDIIELCLLHLLIQKDQYGYELLRQLRGIFSDTKESGVYVILRGLCHEGFSEQYVGITSNGPTRKYYKITDCGIARYNELQKRWHIFLTKMFEFGIN